MPIRMVKDKGSASPDNYPGGGSGGGAGYREGSMQDA
jgi:hypothetical protein